LYAQVGVAAVLSDKDTIESHIMTPIDAGVELAIQTPYALPLSIQKKVLNWAYRSSVPFTR